MEFENAQPVTLSELREGDIVIVDGGYDCLRENEMAIVQRDEQHRLFIRCDEGQHFLDGQCDYDDPDKPLVGVRRALMVGVR